MDYHAHYERLIERARDRKLDGYSERHHVVPKCLGGGNLPENIVRLTPEEHYVAHQLLVKMHLGHRGILWAASNMTGANARQPQRRNKLYGWLRRRLAEDASQRWTGRKISPEACAKMSAARRGKKRAPRSAETRAKISIASLGRKKSLKHRAALSAAKIGKKRGPHSEEHRRRLSESNKVAAAKRDRSQYRSHEYRAKQAATMREIWAKRSTGDLPMPSHDPRSPT